MSLDTKEVYMQSVKQVLELKGLSRENVTLQQLGYDFEVNLSCGRRYSEDDRIRELACRAPKGAVAIASYESGQRYSPPAFFFAAAQRNWASGFAIIPKTRNEKDLESKTLGK